MELEWDAAKRESNLTEHGIDFAHAALIFRNPVLEEEDTRQDYGEHRVRAMGHYDGQWFFVVYTWRGNKRRIISAWRLDDQSERRYRRLFAGRT